ncbi:MAG: ABC transporter permease subunit [Ilumatobacter sp.]|nr:ABC transporter permease subunit [Ilumatobacter sp.]
MAPITVMVVAIAIGARGLAGEEAAGTMGLLLSNPISRRRVVIEKALAMVVHAAAVGAATFAGVAVADAMSGLGMSVVGIASVSLLVTLLGLGFGALALALGAWTGRTKTAVFGTIAVATTSHLLDAFLPLNDSLEPWAKLTPHAYYLGGDPLVRGFQIGDTAVLATVFATLVVVAVIGFERRDLRRG